MSADHDLLLRRGQIVDGTGAAPFVADIAIDGDRITDIGDLAGVRGREEFDVAGLAVAPGFINMLSWANESLLHDGRSQSDIRQGVTLEVLGEGQSMGPWNERMKQEERAQQGDIKYEIEWTTLGEYLEFLARQGVSPNIASFVGAATIRIHEVGFENREPTIDELDRMRQLARAAMAEGAMGVSSALIYAPAVFAGVEELTALAQVAAEHGGRYISHMRNEGNNLLEAFDEFMSVARGANVSAEVYHLKAAGRDNWHKLAQLIERIELERQRGHAVTADMYPYHASSTGLDTVMPPWVREGGHQAWVERLRDPSIRQRVREEMNTPTTAWDNGYLAAGSPENILLVGFKNDALKPLAGKTLAEVARAREAAPEDTAMDLVVEDDSDVAAAFFTMSEDNIRRKMQVPWISFCSDAQSVATEGVFLKRSPHPRTYGSFARILGKYVRDERLISLEEAVRRLTSLPASNLRIERRGRLAAGNFADIVAFNPAEIADRATFAAPHQYAVGVHHVWVNGACVLKDGSHTGLTPGRVVRGPGYRR